MTENALTIKDIDKLPYDQIAGEFGFVNETEQSAANAPGFPRVTVNNKARDSEGNKIPDGTIKVYHLEHGNVYAEDAYIRIFQQRFFYQRYDENATWQDKNGNDLKGRYVNKSVFVKHPSEEALDEEGGVNCGKFKVDDWDSLSEERKNEWRAAKRYRVIFGLLTVKDAFAEGKKDVFVGRIRKSLNNSKELNLWLSCDNLIKGAAYNALQILESMIKKDLIKLGKG